MFIGKKRSSEHNFWMSYTDLMSGFLVVFIIISAVMYKNYQDKTRESNASLKNLVEEYSDVFVPDDNIKVVFDKSRGSIILTPQNPDKFLFAPGKDEFEESLRLYLDRIRKPLIERTMELWQEHNYKNVELRIEGHTDPNPIKSGSRGSYSSFIENLELSSRRANRVYRYLFNDVTLTDGQKKFMMKNMISVGYSFSQRVRDGDVSDGRKDAASRRIEFRIISK